MDTDSDTELTDRPYTTTSAEEVSDQEQDQNTADVDHAPEQQRYRETMSGIRSFMGWRHIPDVNIATSDANDNPFAGPKQRPVGKISMNLPTDDWLCKKVDKFNLTLVEAIHPEAWKSVVWRKMSL